MIVICAIYNINYKLFGRCVCVWLSLRVWVKQMPFKLMLKATEDKQQNQLQQKKRQTDKLSICSLQMKYVYKICLVACIYVNACVCVRSAKCAAATE